MILILSDQLDQSTNLVIDWLLHLKKEFIRVNSDSLIDLVKIDFNDAEIKILLEIDGRKIDLSKITSYWYRRGNFNISLPNKTPSIDNEIDTKIQLNLDREVKSLIDYIHLYLLKSKNSLGSYFDNFTNKIYNLQTAKECGLSIPKSLLSNNKNSFEKFINETNSITKAISETILFSFSGIGSIKGYTDTLELNDIQRYEKLTYPSLIQENINKKYELRIFYLDSKFYSMAIFSQSSDKTKVDFRNYDKQKPNRTVPFSLPKSIEKKLDKFMKLKNLKTGSIDMIVTLENEFVFLEVNPVGQFGMTSFPCNYFLHKKIAEYL